MADEKEKRRGRPPKPLGDSARGPLTIRLRAELRNDIEQSSVKYGRSLSEEIENRLEVSFAFTQYIRHEWGEDVFRIAQAMASSLSYIEYWKGASWVDDEEAYDLFAKTAVNLIRNYRDQINRAAGRSTPHGDLEGKTPDELGEMFAAMGGLAPPRPRKPPSPAEMTDEQREGRASAIASMRALLSEEAAGEDPEA